MRDLLFTVAMTAISRALILRDRLFRRVPQVCPGGASAVCPGGASAIPRSRHSIESGGNRLDAVFVAPAEKPFRAAILLCHGIGETVDHWLPVQQLLAEDGVASLVFDYSGYGRSTGWISALQCERDAVAAFHLLEELAPATPLSLLGFSLGSGIAAAITDRIRVRRIFLCAAFTSFRDATLSIGFPRPFEFLVAPLWPAERSLRTCAVPVTIIHGDRDELFPVQNALDLAALCGSKSELLILPGLSHNEPFYKPRTIYWNLVLSRL